MGLSLILPIFVVLQCGFAALRFQVDADMTTRFFLLLTVALALNGCAQFSAEKIPGQPTAMPAAAISGKAGPQAGLALFSANAAAGLPAGWSPLLITRTKKRTDYRLVSEAGRTILHAQAHAAASGLMQETDLDPLRYPWLQWRWKVADLLKAADNSQRDAEDSPVRIVLAFDGDKEALSFADQIMFETGKLVSGHDLPYATLMYIWENKAPVDTVINNSRTGRIKMMVAASGSAGVGRWHNFSRNIVQDYVRAFGEKPGRLIGIGVMTDTDNTEESIEAWYGDILLLAQQQAAAQ